MVFQISSVLLDACVLAILKNEDTYGYRLTAQLINMLDVSESTLYPVLRRLQKDGFLNTFDMSFQGRNRRYYRITDEGREQLEKYREDWSSYKKMVDQIFEGGVI